MDREKATLITGASSGIGYELTKLFARDGYNPVLVARNQKQLMQMADELKEKYSVSVKVISKDLSAASAPEEIFTELQQESIGIDALVNNAGFAAYGLFSETDLDTTATLKSGKMLRGGEADDHRRTNRKPGRE